MTGSGGSAGQTGMDTITDFSTTATNGKDKLDISALLNGYSSTANLSSWITRIQELRGNTTVEIDLGGPGAGRETQTIVLQGVTGLAGISLDDLGNVQQLFKVL